MKNKKILCVGNFDSSTGYAWFLIQRLWCYINTHVLEETGACMACFPSVSNYPKILEECRIPVDEFDLSFNSLKYTLRSLSYLVRNRINVVYLTDRSTHSWSYLLLHLFGIKIIVHDHSPGYRPPVRGVKRSLKKIINAVGVFSVDAAIGVSPYVCRRLAEVNCLPQKKIHLVTNGIEDTECYKRYLSGEASENKVTIVTVGRVVEYKGIGFALEVIRDLVISVPEVDIRYLVVGDGPDLNKYITLAEELGITEKVEFLGKRTDVPKILAQCDIAFHPSKGEAMCLSIVEYMRAALPIVTSTNISVNSILEENLDSLFYKEKDISDASKLIESLIINSDRREALGRKAREGFLSKYLRKQMVVSFVSTMNEVINR